MLRFAAGLEKGSASAYDQKVGDAAIPPGAEAFSSREILPGAIYRRMLSVPGAYRYFCIAHEGIGMLGRIVVVPR